jgi:hypothetical protein
MTQVAQTLSFCHGALTPVLDAYVHVFAHETLPLLGVDWTFNVIGQSNYIVCRDLDFYELLACEQPPVDTLFQAVVSSAMAEQEFRFRNHAIDVTTQLTATSMTSVDTSSYAVHHAFSPHGDTWIGLCEDGYRTLHTYPELNAMIMSRSRILHA